MLVLKISMPIIIIGKKAIENVVIARTARTSEDGEYPETNFA